MHSSEVCPRSFDGTRCEARGDRTPTLLSLRLFSAHHAMLVHVGLCLALLRPHHLRGASAPLLVTRRSTFARTRALAAVDDPPPPTPPTAPAADVFAGMQAPGQSVSQSFITTLLAGSTWPVLTLYAGLLSIAVRVSQPLPMQAPNRELMALTHSTVLLSLHAGAHLCGFSGGCGGAAAHERGVDPGGGGRRRACVTCVTSDGTRGRRVRRHVVAHLCGFA